MGRAWGRGEVQTEFWWGNLTERDYLVYLGVDGRIILKWIFRKWDGRAWAGLVCLRIGGRLRALGVDETLVSVKCVGFLDFALWSGLLKVVRVIVVRQFHLLCKYFISDPEFPRQLSAVCNFIKVYLPLCLVFMHPMF
jgi:hypothetical protein